MGRGERDIPTCGRRARALAIDEQAGPEERMLYIGTTFLDLLFLPHFLEAPKSERLLLPKQAAALWEGTMVFGRNRESRSCEAAGRRN